MGGRLLYRVYEVVVMFEWLLLKTSGELHPCNAGSEVFALVDKQGLLETEHRLLDD